MFSRKTKIIGVASLVSVLVSGAVLGGLFFILIGKEADYYAQVEMRAEGRATDRQLAALVTLAENSRESRAALDQYVLPADAVITFLALIESLAREQALGIETRSIAIDPLNSRFETVLLTIAVDGAYEDVTHMLDLLESLPYQSDVYRVSINNNGRESTGVFSLQVTKFAPAQ